MSSHVRARFAVPAAILAVALVAAPAGAAKKKPKPKPKIVLGPNLVVNPSFELSDIEGNPAAAPGSQSQPLLPTGWRFEGLTVLFDHSQNLHHTGKRAAAISGSLSGGDQMCETGTCVNNPTNPAKDATAKYTMLPPHWKSAAAIPVTAGKTYLLSFYGLLSTVTKDKGYDGTVRWVDANGLPVAQQALIVNKDGGTEDWKLQTAKPVVAPAGAVGAVLLLGQSDDAWIGQVAFDDVYFGTYTVT